jgi:hypothetical protein
VKDTSDYRDKAIAHLITCRVVTRHTGMDYPNESTGEYAHHPDHNADLTSPGMDIKVANLNLVLVIRGG